MNVTDFPMLLVEDDPEEIVRVQEALAQANLINPLRIVSDGRKAIAYLSGQEEYADRESHPLPSLVLLDLALSESSGPELLAWIGSQKALKNLPLILLTSCAADQGDSEPAPSLGSIPCLAKPVECDRLVEVMRSVGMYWMILENTGSGVGPCALSPQSRHVLMVDRDADFLRSIHKALRRRAPPIVVDTTLDFADALRRLALNSLDALVYDRGIEEAEDFGFLGKVRAVNADLPVIVLCTERDEDFSTRALQKGATGILLKQVRQDQFSDQLHGHLVAAMTPEVSAAPVAPGFKPTPDSRAAVPFRRHRKEDCPARRQHTEILGTVVTFQNTSWELVRSAPKAEALDALVRIYWKPLYFFVRQRGFGNEEAKDIVQEFLAGALEHGMISRADPLRGRFRTFLLRSLTNFLKDRRRSWKRLKRGGGRDPISLDLDLGEPRVSHAASAGEPPEAILDRAWARGLLGQCISELEGQSSHLQAFELQMQGLDYASIANATGLTETAAKTAVHRLRIRLRGILRSHLGHENATEDEVRREVAEFKSLLA
jgi:RNA polymerase sigma factor (sigma-70 family)